MKTPIKISLAIVALTGLLAGCSLLSSSGPQKPPSALESVLFDTSTNFVPVIFTNVTPGQTITNPATGALVTNAPTTNLVATNQAQITFTPNATAQIVQAVGGGIGNLFGVGGLVTTGLSGLFAWYANLRSRKSSATAATLAQAVETARQIFQATPQGERLDSAFVNWMQQHQTDAGVIQNVAQILDGYVNTSAAQGDAANILKSVLALVPQNLQTAPQKPNPPAAAALPTISPVVGPLA